MKETYYLNGKEVPTIPVPHDCIVKDIKLEHIILIIRFKDIQILLITIDN